MMVVCAGDGRWVDVGATSLVIRTCGEASALLQRKLVVNLARD